MKTLAIIVARGGSKRLPGKNVLPLLDMPLIRWSALFAKNSHLFDHIVLSTDCNDIAQACQMDGVEFPGLRPDHLATDTATSVDVALHALDQAEDAHGGFDAVALLQPTNPFRRLSLWKQAIKTLEDATIPAVIGVSPTPFAPHHCFQIENETLSPLFPEGLSMRGQDLPQTVFVNGSMYVVRANALRQGNSFFPVGTKPIVGDHAFDSIDIDTADDFALAQAVARDNQITPAALLSI